MKRRIEGFSLIEVLIATLVLGVGLLGLATLQISTLRSNRQVHWRTVAVEKSYELADIVRVYKDKLTNGSEPCQVDELQQECNAWKTSLAKLLPNGSGTICPYGGSLNQPDNRNCRAKCGGSGGDFVIKTWWKEGNEWQCFEVVFRP